MTFDRIFYIIYTLYCDFYCFNIIKICFNNIPKYSTSITYIYDINHLVQTFIYIYIYQETYL